MLERKEKDCMEKKREMGRAGTETQIIPWRWSGSQMISHQDRGRLSHTRDSLLILMRK